MYTIFEVHACDEFFACMHHELLPPTELQFYGLADLDKDSTCNLMIENVIVENDFMYKNPYQKTCQVAKK